MKNHAAKPGRAYPPASLFSPKAKPLALAVNRAFPPQRLKPPKYFAPSEARQFARSSAAKRFSTAAVDFVMQAAGWLRGRVIERLRLRVRTLSKARHNAAGELGSSGMGTSPQLLNVGTKRGWPADHEAKAL